MVAGMTAGELADYRCPHNHVITQALEAAREELAEAKTRYYRKIQIVLPERGLPAPGTRKSLLNPRCG
jgi:hypothetical protein